MVEPIDKICLRGVFKIFIYFNCILEGEGLDTSDKTNTFKTKKILKTEKVLRAIHLQYSDISPSPAKPNTENDNSINVAYNYKRSVEEEIQNKKSVVKQIKLDRLQSAKETIPENISYVDINEQ